MSHRGDLQSCMLLIDRARGGGGGGGGGGGVRARGGGARPRRRRPEIDGARDARRPHRDDDPHRLWGATTAQRRPNNRLCGCSER
jgi:hypothetical protein